MAIKKIIIDTNIVFSSLISHSQTLRDIIFNDNFKFFAPNYLFIEIFRKKEKIEKHSKLNSSDFNLYLNYILENINFINIQDISKSNLIKAYQLCKDIDPNDTIFVALSLQTAYSLWTGDKILYDGLKSKDFQQVVNTDDIRKIVT